MNLFLTFYGTQMILITVMNFIFLCGTGHRLEESVFHNKPTLHQLGYISSSFIGFFLLLCFWFTLNRFALFLSISLVYLVFLLFWRNKKTGQNPEKHSKSVSNTLRETLKCFFQEDVENKKYTSVIRQEVHVYNIIN